MKKLFTLLVAVAISFGTLNADELVNAYKKEYTFLKAQKNELAKRLKKDKRAQDKDISKAKRKVAKLQNRYVKLSETLNSTHKKIGVAKETLQAKGSNKEIVSSVIIQAQASLFEYGVEFKVGNSVTQVESMNSAFIKSLELYKTLSSIQKEDGKFYLLDGTTARGQIIKVGNISAYGVSSKGSSALAPAGNGEYKVWNKPSDVDAKAFANDDERREINIFIYENLTKEVEYTKEKTFDDTLKGGGPIGYIILGLGVFGLLLLAIRVILLLRAGSNVKKISNVVVTKVKEGKGDEALDAINGFKGSAARVVKATLRNIDKDREHIEDIVMETIINENTSIDRFGNFVLVLAAVAPLLGLLGTVTGMIATFDIITTHGTGDPKLLSGGISEALVTTMFGLYVAIPLLLLGNLLSGWAQNIKDSMEHSALHIVNIFEKHNA
ncbi:MAG: MotA/TolQ/ExbB proton channel family protein [Campylobacterota bacterium]|nr:MotA/TolQ/ExbB proton channel family protein [Campylobacterota bacterium]